MHKNFIRVKRTQEGEGFAPEFANKYLSVELNFEKAIHATELSLRIYSNTYSHIASDSVSFGKGKPVRKCAFCIGSPHNWDEGTTYYMVIFRNGSPEWFSSFALSFFYDDCSKADIEELDDSTPEKYFAKSIATTQWWSDYESFRFDSAYTLQIVEHFHKLEMKKREEGRSHIPFLLVEGELGKGKMFATKVIAPFMAHDSQTPSYECSFNSLLTGELSWDTFLDNVRKNKVAVIEFSDVPFEEDVAKLVRMFGELIYSDSLFNASFVFYAIASDVEPFWIECPFLGIAYIEDTVFYMPEENDLSSLEPPMEKKEEEEKPDKETFRKAIESYILEQASPKEKTDSKKQELTCEAFTTLQGMIGLGRVKKEIKDARDMTLFIKERRMLNLETSNECRNHFLFLGNPGTGKTTVAKLIGEIYHDMGLLSIGHTVETNRAKLVGEFIGQTEKNTMKAINDARGGVLFIDEAYTLISRDKSSNDFGKEVINVLLPVLTEPNPDMIIILAGYEDKINELIKFNQGLDGRFPLKLHFDDYSAEELLQIAHELFNKNNYIIADSADAKLRQIVEQAVSNRGESFCNGRWIHNLIEHDILKNMAARVMSTPHDVNDRNILCTIEECDIPQICQTNIVKMHSPRRIGFTA
ncbi:MAG: AAA family ATPase [Prevotellaceae bacterium]|nr:AAA family ATPase [Prevotellaceae bacterium]